jgi:hypothetical protein
MTVYSPQTNTFSQHPNPLGYDLELEKQLIAEGTEMLRKDLWEEWKIKYVNVEIFPPVLNDFNPALIDFLLSFQHTLFYNEIGQKFNLNPEQRNALPAVIWNICKSKRWEMTENSLQTSLNLSPQISNQIASLVNQRIIFKAKELASQPFTAKYNKTSSSSEITSPVSLPLSEALRIYPEVGEQLVTSNKINLRNFPYPVRPSIKNWIADYTFNLGYEKHESMARSQYLFQGPNTKNLPASEKNKLAYLLKSFDENSPITVNKATKQIIFPTHIAASVAPAGWASGETAPAPSRPAVAPQAEQKNINSMQFSYRQKLPYEKTIAPAAPIKSLPQNFSNSPRNFQPKSATPQNLPKNVVDLKNMQ